MPISPKKTCNMDCLHCIFSDCILDVSSGANEEDKAFEAIDPNLFSFQEKEMQKFYNRFYYETHKEELRAKWRSYYEEHKEELLKKKGLTVIVILKLIGRKLTHEGGLTMRLIGRKLKHESRLTMRLIGRKLTHEGGLTGKRFQKREKPAMQPTYRRKRRISHMKKDMSEKKIPEEKPQEFLNKKKGRRPPSRALAAALVAVALSAAFGSGYLIARYQARQYWAAVITAIREGGEERYIDGENIIQKATPTPQE